jgi:hypothetical protein
MHGPGQLLGYGSVDHALALHPRNPLERRGLDHYIEMALPTVSCAGMAGVAGGIVVNGEAGGGKGARELVQELVSYGAHYSASLFVACQFLIGKSSAAYFSQ